MGKRKRNLDVGRATTSKGQKRDPVLLDQKNSKIPRPISIQIITGSYDRILHGITATILPKIGISEGASGEVQFADTFLFNAHRSAIRCLAISPASLSEDATQSQKLILASGSTDERINLYHISATAANVNLSRDASIPSLTGTMVKENPKNRELGSLLHHSSNVNALFFPSRSKLLSAADDNTIAISRTRDWTVLSTIKAPIPKAVGRPSGDTAPLGGTPAGVNDFAVHPSMKLMISVGKGEKCMRLWNLVTGKKAGVLNFERELLQGVGEGKWGTGEGRKVEWNNAGDEFVIGFEKGAVIFGMDSKPKCRILTSPITKLQQVRYLPKAALDEKRQDVLAISTEDGRILFYCTNTGHPAGDVGTTSKPIVPYCEILSQLGGKASGILGRIKDFEILKLPAEDGGDSGSVIVTASSDGAIRLWKIYQKDFAIRDAQAEPSAALPEGGMDEINGKGKDTAQLQKPPVRQVGAMFGMCETGNRITCLKAFVMQISSEVVQSASEQEEEDEFNGIESSNEESDN